MSWWTRTDALNYAKLLNEQTRPLGWPILMGGSALYKDEGGKDLDLMAYPSSLSSSVCELRSRLPPHRVTEVPVAWVLCWEVHGNEVELIILKHLPADVAESHQPELEAHPAR